jgi:pimeloyl-ACP methyl ester carboxylesterase
VADALGYGRLGIWGISGGGPYALACAALLPDLAIAVAAVASVAPYGIEGFDYFAGMGELNSEDIKLSLADPDEARRRLREDWKEVVETRPEQLQEILTTVLSPVDSAALTPELAEWLARVNRDGLAPGEQGWWDDGMSHVMDWGFDVRDIRVPVKIWHGRHDRFVPVQHGEWLAASIPGAEAEISDHDGHLSMTARIGEIHDWLLERM